VKNLINTPRKNLNQSAFWRIGSPRKLAEILGTDLDELEAISLSWVEEYSQFPLDNRWIETPKPRLHKIQKKIHKLLCRIGPPAYLFSGFKGRSSFMSTLEHDGSMPFVKMDIRKFYPSSDGRLVFEFFNKKLGCAADVSTILFKLCTIKGTSNSSKAHLPTGGVTSPILAYFCYMDMFEELKKLADSNQLAYSVMADDICMSGQNASPIILKEAEKIIASYRLKSNWKKRRFWNADYPNKIVTGVQITPKGLRVPLARKKKIMELQLELSKTGDVKERMKIYQKRKRSMEPPLAFLP
jgi:hypothetical protein